MHSTETDGCTNTDQCVFIQFVVLSTVTCADYTVTGTIWHLLFSAQDDVQCTNISCAHDKNVLRHDTYHVKVFTNNMIRIMDT